MSPGWPLSAPFHEAWANLRSSPIRIVILGIGIGGLLVALVWVELASTGRVKDLSARYLAAGADIAVVDAPNGLDAARCDDLKWQPPVLAAGGVRANGQVSAASEVGVRFQAFAATAGLVKVWDPQVQPAALSFGRLVGQSAAQELGLIAGSWVQLASRGLTQVGLIDPGLRNPAAARAFIDLIPPSERVDQCWVEFRDSGSLDEGLAWLTARFAADRANVRALLAAGTFAVSPASEFSARPEALAWIPAGIIGAAVLTFMGLFRRSEIALYRAFGLTKIGVLVLHQVESLITVSFLYLTAVVWATLVYAFTIQVPGADQLLVSMETAGLAATLMAIAGPVGAFVIGLGSPAQLLKEG